MPTLSASQNQPSAAKDVSDDDTIVDPNTISLTSTPPKPAPKADSLTFTGNHPVPKPHLTFDGANPNEKPSAKVEDEPEEQQAAKKKESDEPKDKDNRVSTYSLFYQNDPVGVGVKNVGSGAGKVASKIGEAFGSVKEDYSKQSQQPGPEIQNPPNSPDKTITLSADTSIQPMPDITASFKQQAQAATMAKDPEKKAEDEVTRPRSNAYKPI